MNKLIYSFKVMIPLLDRTQLFEIHDNTGVDGMFWLTVDKEPLAAKPTITELKYLIYKYYHIHPLLLESIIK